MTVFDRRGRLRQIVEVDPWALYVAQMKGEQGGLVKVGVSMDPERRARDMLRGHPIERFVWAWAGTKQNTYKLAAFIHKAFAARQMPGEWFGFDFASADDKRFFNETVRQAYGAMTGRALRWSSVDLAEIRRERETQSVNRSSTVRRRRPWER